MTELGVLAAAFGYGIASAIIPILNVEAYVAVNVVAFGAPMVTGLVVALTLGTTIGKIIVFQGARAGKEIVRTRASRRPPRTAGPVRQRVQRVSGVLLSWLDRPYQGALTVLVAAFIGIPPLLAVAVIAGASRQNVWLFAAAVAVGRAARFTAIAAGIAFLGEM